MVAASQLIMIVVILTVGGAVGTVMAIEDFDLMEPSSPGGEQVREVGPRAVSDGSQSCDLHDGDCGDYGEEHAAACGTGGGCC